VGVKKRAEHLGRLKNKVNEEEWGIAAARCLSKKTKQKNKKRGRRSA